MFQMSWAERSSMAMLAVGILVVTGPFCCFQFPASCDVMQFYGAGDMINRGEAYRLYDQTRFQELQLLIAGGQDCTHHYSLYPPTVGLMLAPSARLPFDWAIKVWFATSLVLLGVFGYLAYRYLDIPKSRRTAALLALVSPVSLWMTLHIGQLTPVWMLAMLGGLLLHREKRPLACGLALSLLAMKPQLLVMPAVWMLLRRDWRTVRGLILGCVLQLLAVVVFLGPYMPQYFLRELPQITQAAKTVDYPACYEQSIAGTIKTMLIEYGWLGPENRWLVVFLQVIPFMLATALLWQVVRSVCARATQGTSSAYDSHYEYACLGLATLLSTPHLLLYDATLVVVPIAFLLATPAWPWGAALLAAETTVAAVVYLFVNACLMPVVAFWALYRIARDLATKPCSEFSTQHSGHGTQDLAFGG